MTLDQAKSREEALDILDGFAAEASEDLKQQRLRRSLDGSNRKRQTQVKCTIGAAVLALAVSGKG